MPEQVPSPSSNDSSRWQRWWSAVRQHLDAWILDEQVAREKLYRRADAPLQWLVGLLIIGGLSTEIAAYGFALSTSQMTWVVALREGVVWSLVVAFGVRLSLTAHRRTFLQRQWLWGAVVVVFLLSVLVEQIWGASGEQRERASWSLVAMVGQSLIVVVAILEGARYSRNIATWQLRPAQILALSFAALIMGGSLLLMLPNATTAAGSMPAFKALFTATSAVCVTGLIVVDTATYFTRFGQGIILLLCQLGGLGILTFATVFSMMLSGSLGLRERMLIQDFTASQEFGEISATVGRIVGLTLLIEGLGAAILYWSWPAEVVASEPRLWISIFHAVSAFCNAGFSTFSHSLADAPVAFSLGVNLTVMVLIILGGLGFSVLWEGGLWAKGAVRKQPFRLSVQSRLVWVASGSLLMAGAVGIALLEADGAFANCTGNACWLGALFQSVTARTAGFNTIPLEALKTQTVFLMIILMVIGVSPGSTGGGMKTTTVAVLLMSTVARIRGQARVETYRRTISWDVVNQAYATFFFFIASITIALFILSITEEKIAFIDLFFEEVSAFATVGLSRGVTDQLSPAGQLVIMISMFIGRVGSLTLAIALARQVSTTAYEYPTESVMVG